MLTPLLALLVACLPAQSTAESGGINSPEHREKAYVVLVSFDGFRADYLDRFDLPNFRRVITSGVRAEALIPVFPTKTFPNHYSIATGLYADRHGIVANSFFDPQRNSTYALSNRAAVQDGSWYGGEPIWVTAETQGMVTACFFWPGSEADVQGIRPTFWKEYDGSIPHEARVDEVVSWLNLPAENRPHLITVYFANVDDAGHRFGPASPEIERAVRAADRTLGRLLDGLESTPVHGRIHLVIVSDHGMAEYTPEHFIPLESLIDDMTGIRIADSGTTLSLHVSGPPARAGAVRDAINANLQVGRAYLRQEIPERLHYRKDPRIGDVLVLMEESYLIGLQNRAPSANGGNHGWDPALTSMHTIFLAMGPETRAGVTIPHFESVDIYPFLAELLGLEYPENVDGRRGWLHGQVMAN